MREFPGEIERVKSKSAYRFVLNEEQEAWIREAFQTHIAREVAEMMGASIEWVKRYRISHNIKPASRAGRCYAKKEQKITRAVAQQMAEEGGHVYMDKKHHRYRPTIEQQVKNYHKIERVLKDDNPNVTCQRGGNHKKAAETTSKCIGEKCWMYDRVRSRGIRACAERGNKCNAIF